MDRILTPADLDWRAVLAAWPTAAFLLDREGAVLTHGGSEGGLRAWWPADARGRNFFVDVLGGGEVAELGGAFHSAMDDEDRPLDLNLAWHVDLRGRRADVRVRLRKIGGGDQPLCIATIEDDTRLQTAESALAAAMGEVREQQDSDVVTGLWGRRQFDFLLPIELRRGHRYGVGTTLLGIDAGWEIPQPPGGKGVGGTVALQDPALRALGEQLQVVFRLSDVSFRFAPSRFHVILTHTDAGAADGALRRLVSATSHLSVPGVPAGQLLLRMAMSSSGTFEAPAQYVQIAQEMLAQVDAQLDAD